MGRKVASQLNDSEEDADTEANARGALEDAQTHTLSSFETRLAAKAPQAMNTMPRPRPARAEPLADRFAPPYLSTTSITLSVNSSHPLLEWDAASLALTVKHAFSSKTPFSAHEVRFLRYRYEGKGACLSAGIIRVQQRGGCGLVSIHKDSLFRGIPAHVPVLRHLEVGVLGFNFCIDLIHPTPHA